MPHFVPPWLVVDRPRSISTIRKIAMSLLDKLTKKKPATVDSHTARLQAISKFDSDISAALIAAERAGVTSATIIDILEKKENAERYRMAAGLKF
jgi:hypothetical protein